MEGHEGHPVHRKGSYATQPFSIVEEARNHTHSILHKMDNESLLHLHELSPYYHPHQRKR